MLKKLTEIARSQPHAAFAALTQCLQSQWTFLTRAMPDVAHLFQPLEEEIRVRFLPSLLKREINDQERSLFSLPARLGGLGIQNPTEACEYSFANSMRVSDPLD